MPVHHRVTAGWQCVAMVPAPDRGSAATTCLPGLRADRVAPAARAPRNSRGWLRPLLNSYRRADVTGLNDIVALAAIEIGPDLHGLTIKRPMLWMDRALPSPPLLAAGLRRSPHQRQVTLCCQTAIVWYP